jgi:hypothetical protein
MFSMAPADTWMNVIAPRLPVYSRGDAPGDINIPKFTVGATESSRYLTLAPSHIINAEFANIGGESCVGDANDVSC